MELKNAINNRRSIRKYKEKPITEVQIRDIIRSGMAAPSAGNLQSRRFFSVSDSDAKEKLASAAFNQSFIAQAPVAIVVCADLRIRKEYGQRGVDLYAPMDCAAAIQNIALTAHEIGLGTCWVGAFDEQAVRAELKLPTFLRPVAIIPVGVPDESPAPPQRIAFDDACEIL